MYILIIQSIIVGLAVSIPVGPVGVLCIQRTLTRGRWHGVATGLGATTSDIIYATLVGLSMGYIINFIDANRTIIQIVGSIVICAFGLHLYFKKTTDSKSPHHLKIKRTDLLGDYLSGFGLCFTNPLIIFIFIALFTQFEIYTPDNFLSNIVAVVSILAGALLWWLTLTMIVSTARSKFNVRRLTIFNRVAGVLLMLFGVVGIVKLFI